MVDGYPTKKPIRLLYRNGKEAVFHLFANPVFAHHMDFDGRTEEVQRRPGGDWESEVSEFSTGEYFKTLNVSNV